MLYITQYEQEGSGIQWSNVFVPPVEAEIFNVGVTCIFLLIDSILYGVIGVTVIFIKDLKRSEKERLSNTFSKIANCWLISVDIGTEESSLTQQENGLDSDLANQNRISHENETTKNVAVQLQNLTKRYKISRKEERIAVSNLSLSFNVGEVRNLFPKPLPPSNF